VLSNSADCHSGAHVRRLVLIVVSALVALSATSAPASAEAHGDLRIVGVSVNGGHAVLVGTEPVEFPFRVRVREQSRITRLELSMFNAVNGKGYADMLRWGCSRVSSTASVCRGAMSIDPRGLAGYSEGSANLMARRWQVNVRAWSRDGDWHILDDATPMTVKRATRTLMTTSARQVAAGAQLRITGILRRANWETQRFGGWSRHPVELRFRPTGSTSFRTVTVVSSREHGALAASVVVRRSGTWRWRYLGASRSTATVITVS